MSCFSFIKLNKNANKFRIQLIVDALQFTNPYGFGPSLIRKCTDRLKALKLEASGDCSMPFITSLFSLIYHIAGFVYGKLLTYHHQL